jgi:hypothetical protein
MHSTGTNGVDVGVGGLMCAVGIGAGWQKTGNVVLTLEEGRS